MVSGSVLVTLFAAYTLIAAVGDLGDAGATLGALSLLGLILLTVPALTQPPPRLRQRLVIAGAVMVLAFLAYTAVDRARTLADGVTAAALFATAGALGLLLVVTGTMLRRARS